MSIAANIEDGCNDSDSSRRTGSPSVVIACAIAARRNELARILNGKGGFHIARVTGSADEAIQDLANLSPDVLVVDLDLERSSDLVRGTTARTNIVLLANPDDKEQIAEALKLGCSGMVRRNASPKSMVESIRAVQMGRVWLDPQIAETVASLASPQRAKVRNTDDHTSLSEREQEIVRLVAQGYRNSGIAEELHVNEQTVKNYLYRIFKKLGITDRLDLALFAVDKRWHLADTRPPVADCSIRLGSHRNRQSTTLSEREHQIVQLITQGCRNSGIARRMQISEQTVKNHLHNIFSKLGVSDRLDLALYALDKRWYL